MLLGGKNPIWNLTAKFFVRPRIKSADSNIKALIKYKLSFTLISDCHAKSLKNTKVITILFWGRHFLARRAMLPPASSYFLITT